MADRGAAPRPPTPSAQRGQSRFHQRFRPVQPQINGHRDVPGGRCQIVGAECLGLECQHFRLIDLVDRAAVQPGQPPGPRVQPGREDDRLLDTVCACRDEELVKPLRARSGVASDAPEPLDHVRRRFPPPSLRGGVEKQPSVGVAEQWAFTRRLFGACHRHTECGLTDTLGDVPAVVVSSGHCRRIPRSPRTHAFRPWSTGRRECSAPGRPVVRRGWRSPER